MDLTLVEYMNIIVTSIVGYVLYNEKENYMKYSKENQNYGKNYIQCNGKQMDVIIQTKQYLTLKNNFGKKDNLN